jgi:hypothetical protein
VCVVFDWIVVGLLYCAGIAFFHLIGGVASAGEAFRRWGGAYAERRRARGRLPSISRSSPDRRRDA